MKTKKEIAKEIADDPAIIIPEQGYKLTAYRAALAAIDAAQQWISVDDELPEKHIEVLVKLEDKRVTISFIFECGDFAYNVKPTHWRPINLE